MRFIHQIIYHEQIDVFINTNQNSINSIAFYNLGRVVIYIPSIIITKSTRLILVEQFSYLSHNPDIVDDSNFYHINQLLFFAMSEADPQKNLNEFNKFLANNTDFLNEKYQQHFVNPFPLTDLQTKAKIETAIKYIYDVFSFQKYEKDQRMNATLKKSLRDNILGFLKGQDGKQNRQFNPNDGVRLLKYCIQNNEMFAVHYEKKDKQIVKEDSPKKAQQNPPPKQNQPIEENTNQDQIEENEVQAEIVQANKDQPTQQNKIVLNISQITQKSKRSNKQQFPKEETVVNNEFSEENKNEEEKRRLQVLKKQAKVVFQFYCKQQLNSGGPNSTFDKILHESNTMTLGKFVAFANTTKILCIPKIQSLRPKSNKILDKKTINELFRKISKGQKQIDFNQFFELLCTLNEVDNTVYEKLNMNRSQTHNKILRKLKYLSTPFNMKVHLEQQAHPVIDDKPFLPISTAHSGKFQSSLQEDMEERKMKLRLLPHQPYPNHNQIKTNETFIIEPKINMSQNLRESDLLESKIKGENKFFLNRKGESKTTAGDKKEISKIRLQNSRIFIDKGQKLFNNQQISALQNLIVPDDDNDEQFLKDYKIPKLSSNAGLNKKHNNISFTHRQIQSQKQSQRKFSGFKTQRKNVVGELKQRILEVQSNERKQLTGIQNKRRAISNLNKN